MLQTTTSMDDQVLPRDAKMGTTVEHVKQLRDDITTTTAQSFRDTFLESDKVSEDRAARLEARMGSLEVHLAKITALLENGNTYGAGRVGGAGTSSGSGSGMTARTSTSTSNGSATIASNHRSTNSQLNGSHHSGA